MERVRVCVCVRERKCRSVCVLASVDSGRAWHAACQTVCVFVHTLCVFGGQVSTPSILTLPPPQPAALQSGICPLVY